MKRVKRINKGAVVIGLCLMLLLSGCGKWGKENAIGQSTEELAENVILSETGELVDAENMSEPIPTQEPEQEAEPKFDTDYTPIKPQVELTLPEHEQVITEEDQIEPTDTNLMQLVFLGDSIFDNNRDGTGVPYLTSELCNADVYNLAIGGTSATIEWDEAKTSEDWSSKGLCGIVKALKKEIPTDIFAGTRTKEIIDNPKIDFSKTDYFIIEYGLNDYFRAAPRSMDDDLYDVRCYTGALRYAVSNLTDIAPDATIILCSPTYAQFYNNGYLIGEGNMTNTGYGTLFDYAGTCNYVANEQQTLFFNAYEDLGITGYTADQYLEDGVHLTEEGRQLYAEKLAKIILSHEETKNN